MISWGIVFLILGIGSFILPSMGVQFKLLTLFGNAQPVVAVILIIAGAIMTVVGIMRRKK
ncbi:MAG: hypothetical protein JW913_07785 [Chitinispirillaceae bacterium]|nr:hypothetical protein [Chitinispirillaceae bacterium]